MNRELPKPLQDALARQTAGEVHPSPDLLTAFAEHSLPSRESQRVTDHLAQCADCREVVFLASSAVEEPVGEENEWMPADAISRISPVLRAKITTASSGSSHAQSRRRWMLRWAWAPAVVAVLIVAGVVFLRRSEFMRPAPVTVASKEAQLAVTAPHTPPATAGGEEAQPELRTALAPPKPVAKSAHTQANQAPSAGALVAGKIEPGPSTEYESAPKAGALPPAPSSTAPGSLDALLKTAPAVSMQSGFAESASPAPSNLVAGSQSLVPNPHMAKQSVSAAHLQWHITPDGHLEQRGVSGSWTRVLAEQAITFLVVSVVGNNIWAGGSGGALFHSSDGGQNWSRQPIGSPPDVETDTIVAIRFSDATHGVVTTEGSARWSTSDGGATWTKE